MKLSESREMLCRREKRRFNELSDVGATVAVGHPAQRAHYENIPQLAPDMAGGSQQS